MLLLNYDLCAFVLLLVTENFVLFCKSFFACWRVTSFACAKEVTKKTHPGALALRASLAEWYLLQGRFDARPCLSKLKWPSMAILPWQMPLCEAALMGTDLKAKAKAKATAKAKALLSVRLQPDNLLINAAKASV